MKPRIICSLLLFIWQVGILSASPFYFKKYEVEKGLSHNSVWCLLQDQYGFMWFGTSDGLNRFDGKNFKIYRNERRNNYSLGNNSVQSLYEDESGDLWIGTTNGIYIYDREKDQFQEFQEKTEYGVTISTEVKKIIRTTKGQIWIGTLGQGLFIYDKESGELRQNSQHTSYIWDIAEESNHLIYTSSLEDGLICYDQNGKFIETINAFFENKDLNGWKINSICATDHRIWFSVGTNNLTVYNTKTRRLQYYTGYFSNGTVKSIAPYSENELLVGSDNGLYLFDMTTGAINRMDVLLDPRGLSDHMINAILKDAEGGFWIATYLGGVNYLAKQTKVFDYYPPAYTPNASTGKVANCFREDKSGNIWIGFQDGIKIYDPQTEKLTPFTVPGNNSKPDVRSLWMDENELWIGTYAEGLKRLNIKTGRIREYFHRIGSPTSICSNDVLSLFRDSRGDLYVGTTWGLCRYKPETDDFETVNFVGTLITVSDITEDAAGYLWIATTSSGAIRFNVIENHWTYYYYEENSGTSQMVNSVNVLFRDSEDRIWIGTNGAGLRYFDESTDSFIDFDPDNIYLPGKVVASVEEDNLGNLWISGTTGLLRIHPVVRTNRKLFTREDGLQSNQFNYGASLKSWTGKLFFGGINGFNAFYPADFRENDYIPPVYITDLRLYNKTEDETHDLLGIDKNIYLADKVILPYKYNSIILRFNSLSFEEPDKNQYLYRLEGFDKSWINSRDINYASYTNLPPGDYQFTVKGSNNDLFWNEQPATIRIRVLPPWWRTGYAYVAYLLSFILFLYLLVTYWVGRSKKDFERKLERFQTEKEKEVYQSKINFFINLVHEIRTPLSLINLPLERLTLKNEKDPENVRYLGAIDRNVKYLMNVVNQLLDFQKIETQEPTLDLRSWSVRGVLREIYEQFVDSVELKQIRLIYEEPEEEIYMRLDKGKLVKIITNLLSNAVKFASGRILLSIQKKEDKLLICVMDDGPGVPEGEGDKIFEPFYQLEQGKQIGTGIGLAFSNLLAKQHKGVLKVENGAWGGCLFTLILPLEYPTIPMDIQPSETILLPENTFVKKETSKKKQRDNKYRLLLVEDNRELLEMMDEFLQPEYHIFKANEGRMALDILAQESIDLIISDVMMPGMDGFELTRAVKSDINYSHIPLILLTAKTNLNAKIEGLEHGAEVYLEKPFSITYLQKQIRNLIRLRQRGQELLSSFPPAPIEELPLPAKEKEFLDKLHQEIEGQLMQPEFSTDMIADNLCMSRSSFYRKVKSITGMTPSDYLKIFRLNKAAELLLENKYSITEICDILGFGSSSYFAKCFKSQFGVLPREYIEEGKKKKREV